MIAGIPPVVVPVFSSVTLCLGLCSDQLPCKLQQFTETSSCVISVMCHTFLPLYHKQHMSEVLDSSSSVQVKVSGSSQLEWHCGQVVKALDCRPECPRFELASYPGLLTPAFVACSTNTGEGLVKLSHVH